MQVDEYSNRVADYFLSLRPLQKGDTVAVYMSNRVEFIGIWLGLAKIGLVPALINSHQRQKSLEHAIIASNSKVYIFRFILRSKEKWNEELRNNISSKLYRTGGRL